MNHISVYLDNGVVYEYEVDTPERARDHVYQIITTGCRHTEKDSKDLVWFPPHRLYKVVATNSAESSKYRDTVRAT